MGLKILNSVLLNGQSSLIDASSGILYNPSGPLGDFAVEIWCRPMKWQSVASTVLSKFYDQGGQQTFQIQMVTNQGPGNRSVDFYGMVFDGANNACIGKFGTNLPVNQWYQLVLVYIAGTVQFYINAVAQTGTYSYGSFTSINNTNFDVVAGAIKNSSNQWDRFFPGYVNQLRIYGGGALSSQQVTELYNEGKPVNPGKTSARSILTNYFPLGGSSDTVSAFQDLVGSTGPAVGIDTSTTGQTMTPTDINDVVEK